MQIDDSSLGRERNGDKPGRGSENTRAFLIAMETNKTLEYPRHAGIEPMRSIDNDSLREWTARRLAPAAKVYFDGLFCSGAGHARTALESEEMCAACEVKDALWVNIVLAKVNRTISGRYYAIRQGKHTRLHLAEAAYRFNRRFCLR